MITIWIYTIADKMWFFTLTIRSSCKY